MLDKLKKNNDNVGNKLDVSGGKIFGNLNIEGILKNNNKTILDLTYPIGAIYMSIKNTNPSSLFGGTWVAWGSGRVPVGVDPTQTEFNAVEKTGGEKTHTLTIGEIPNHSHGENTISEYGFNYPLVSNNGEGDSKTGWLPTSAGSEVTKNQVLTDSTGGNQPHNNLQPYVTCYMWKRTA